METDLVLRLPREEEEEFLRAHRATSPEVPCFLHYYQEGMTFRRYLEVLRDREHGTNLRQVTSPPRLFAFVGQRIVGRVSIRHALNAFLERAGGHIGYVVVPEFRRRGYATTILRLSFQIAHKALGIPHVLVICADDNAGSIKTIERNGGVLESVDRVPGFEKPMRRYWIEASA